MEGQGGKGNLQQKVVESTQAGSGGHFWMARGHTKTIDVNGSAVFLVGKGAEQQERGNKVSFLVLKVHTEVKI